MTGPFRTAVCSVSHDGEWFHVGTPDLATAERLMGLTMTVPADVATIPAGASFVDVLASGLIEEAGDDLFQLADTLVLLPNRRACRR